ncbi:pilus assembly PilX family protein [Deefgea salmonis]|uniref:Type 4 fimbrial biogenesis protein PilX N-terminal domain-containing protein n=1 Tax=Deefgea salmonis TaxID=2875502 RepID=A0ABS8BML7_9NEIS|nr:PilX N-terminal domain-containing pilus assembly protein [Deefgea salmonis]MCB5196963.1 hypothetical protein [Deefgea salmonis]
MYESNRQDGFVLITSIIFLIAITIAVVYAVKSATSVERSAGNYRARAQAFQMAQLALQRAQAQLVDDISFSGIPLDQCQKGLCGKNAYATLISNGTWTDDNKTCHINNATCNKVNSANTSQTLAISGVAAQPRWALRDLNQQDADGCTLYEVWAAGTGAEANSSVLIRSLVKAC